VPFIVTGISQDGDTTALEAALTAAGLSLDALDVLGPDDSEAKISSIGLIDTGILTGGGLETGTGVPGLTGSGIPGITSAPPVAAEGGNDTLWERLDDLEIPDDEVENYAEALEAGRFIIGYHGTAANVALVDAVFRDSGLTKIKTF
jgi:hypothetical protein